MNKSYCCPQEAEQRVVSVSDPSPPCSSKSTTVTTTQHQCPAQSRVTEGSGSGSCPVRLYLQGRNTITALALGSLFSCLIMLSVRLFLYLNTSCISRSFCLLTESAFEPSPFQTNNSSPLRLSSNTKHSNPLIATLPLTHA